MQGIAVEKSLSTIRKMFLKLVEPDFLGDSMWEFRHGRAVVVAKIIDTEWLRSYQARQIDIRPQDSIEADVQVITKYDYDNELISVNHNIVKVYKTVPHCGPQQKKLFDEK